MRKKQKNDMFFWHIWGLFLLCICIFFFSTTYIQQQKESTKESTKVSTNFTLEITPTPYPTEIPPQETSDCTIHNNWATVTFTNINGWTCSVQNFHDNTSYVMQLELGRLNIVVSDLGRDGFCQGDLKCVTQPFFVNKKMDLQMYTYDNEDKEIWGNFPPTKNGEKFAGHISIKYTEMETKKLTSPEKNNIFSLLNSLEYSFTH